MEIYLTDLPFHNALYPHLWTTSKIARYQEFKSLIHWLQTEHHNIHSTKSGDFYISPHIFKGLNFEVRVVGGVRGLVGVARVRSWVMKV